MSPETDHLKDMLGRARREIGKIIIGQQQVIIIGKQYSGATVNWGIYGSNRFSFKLFKVIN